MSAWQWIVGLVLLLHGVGQLLGVLVAGRPADAMITG